jgi:hypothetical protein
MEGLRLTPASRAGYMFFQSEAEFQEFQEKCEREPYLRHWLAPGWKLDRVPYFKVMKGMDSMPRMIDDLSPEDITKLQRELTRVKLQVGRLAKFARAVRKATLSQLVAELSRIISELHKLQQDGPGILDDEDDDDGDDDVNNADLAAAEMQARNVRSRLQRQLTRRR